VLGKIRADPRQGVSVLPQPPPRIVPLLLGETPRLRHPRSVKAASSSSGCGARERSNNCRR